jgi:TolA-binding protein
LRTRIGASLLAVLALVSASGCVYYNTFYHAKAAATEAEFLREARPPDSDSSARERALLERVVEKSGRVLRLHPDSEWADDALLLMGTALYHQGKLESAADRLKEFLALYPQSELVPEARYTLGAVLLRSGNPVSAEETLAKLAFADPPHRLSDDALALIGDARRARGRHETAAQAYLDALQRFPESDIRARIRFSAAENYIDMKRPEEAVTHYAAVATERGARHFLFDARMRLAEAYLGLRDSDAALTVLRDLEARAILDDDLDEVLLLTGRAYEVMGDAERAVSTYEGIAASRDRSAAAAEAHYRIGLIHRDRDRDLEAAALSFETARQQAPRSDPAKLAAAAVADVGKLREYLAAVDAYEAAPADTVAVAPAPDDTTSAAAEPRSVETTPQAPATPSAASARLRAAEIYLFHFGDPESALSYYESVIELYPESEIAPKAALAVAWTLENMMDDPAGAAEAYLRVIELFPGTEFAAAAEEYGSRLPAGERPDAEPARAQPTDGGGPP